MIPKFAVYLFDVDSTLLDSAPDIIGAVRETLPLPCSTSLTDEFLRGYIGYHLRDFYLDVLPGCQESELEAMVKHYRAVYPARGHRGTRLYPHVEEVLGQLGGLKSTATTKATETARNILTQFGLISYFDRVQGTDGFPCKPEPDVVLKSVEAFGVAPEDCLLIGDAAPDMEAGRRAGVRTCAVTYGYGNPQDMRQHQPDFWISSLRELIS